MIIVCWTLLLVAYLAEFSELSIQTLSLFAFAVKKAMPSRSFKSGHKNQ